MWFQRSVRAGTEVQAVSAKAVAFSSGSSSLSGGEGNMPRDLETEIRELRGRLISSSDKRESDQENKANVRVEKADSKRIGG